eukprot:gene20766-26926_t
MAQFNDHEEINIIESTESSHLLIDGNNLNKNSNRNDNISVNKRSSNDFGYTLNRDGYAPNQYFLDDSPDYFSYAVLSDTIAVIEPYADMYLYPKSGAYSDDSSKSTSVNLECAAYDKYTLTINAITINSEVADSTSGTAMCMYVRREIRDLTDKDLSSTMLAMHELWAVDSDTGKELYGSSYLSAKNLLEMHYFQASWRDTDHSHEGKDLSFSPMYTNKTFGTIQPPKQWKYSNGDTVLSGAIPDSLWAYQIIEPNTRYSDMKYGYSYMRSPWSTNPSPYVSRYTYIDVTLPTCEHHYDTFNYEILSDYLNNIENHPHGNAHFGSGGVLGCDLLEPLVDDGIFPTIEDSYEFCHTIVLKTKFWYRDYMITVQKDCYVEDNDFTDHENFNCGMVCDDSIEGKEAFYSILISYSSIYLTNTDDSTLEVLRQFICDGDFHKIITGDQFMSSSAADPAFWPIHPTLERLYHAKLMTSGFSSSEYPDGEKSCSYPECYDYLTEEYGYYDSCCDGHYSYGQLFDYFSVSRESYIGLTNLEMYAATDPTSSDYSMSYVYDNFQWSHCADSADIDALIASSAQ